MITFRKQMRHGNRLSSHDSHQKNRSDAKNPQNSGYTFFVARLCKSAPDQHTPNFGFRLAGETGRGETTGELGKLGKFRTPTRSCR